MGLEGRDRALSRFERSVLGRSVWGFLIGCVTCAITVSAQGQGAPTTLSGYEGERLAQELRTQGLTVSTKPEGKRVSFIQISRHPVFEEGEFWPDFVVWFNHLHWQTREQVVRRELTFAEGEPFQQRAADETMRNLRSLGIFALVRVLAVQTPDPEQVGVLVFVRDLWSLRLESDFTGAGQNFRLEGQLTERNLFGNNTQAAIRGSYKPITTRFGQYVRDRRLFGLPLQLTEFTDVYYNYRDQRVEGGTASVRLDRPFYNLQQRYGFSVVLQHHGTLHRDLDGGETARVNLAQSDGGSCDLAQPDCARSLYRESIQTVQLRGHYRTGRSYKHTWSIGAGATRRAYRQVNESAVAPDFEAEFADKVLPRSRNSIYPFLGYSLQVPQFAYFRNLATYGSVESVQLGPRVEATVSVPIAALGSTYDAMLVTGEGVFVWANWNALVDLMVSAQARLEQGRLRDQLLELRLRTATPPWFWGRLLWSGQFQGRRRDSARTFVALGGDNGLRGYPSGFLRGYGAQLLRLNMEYRTAPVEVSSVHLGGVVFWDAGSVYALPDRPKLSHGLGLGLRVLFPQLNVYPFRFDVGFPLEQSGFSVLLSYGAGQLVPLTKPEDDLLNASF